MESTGERSAAPLPTCFPPSFCLLSFPRAPLLRSRHDLLLPPSLHQFKQRANSTHTPLRSEFDSHPCMLGSTPTLLYARIQTWRELQPHSYTLGFKNAEQDGRYVYIYGEIQIEREKDICHAHTCIYRPNYVQTYKDIYIHTTDKQTDRQTHVL